MRSTIPLLAIVLVTLAAAPAEPAEPASPSLRVSLYAAEPEISAGDALKMAISITNTGNRELPIVEHAWIALSDAPSAPATTRPASTTTRRC